MHTTTERPPPSPTRLLGRWSRGEIPFVQQLAAVDCGPACVAMVLRFHGHFAGLDDVRRVIGLSRGSTASSLLGAARSFGLRARAVRAEIDGLSLLPRGSVLHWDFNHYVVLDEVTAEGLTILDPAMGRRRVPLAQASDSFTGVALVLEPGEDFVAAPDRRPSGLRRYAAKLAGHAPTLARIALVSILIRLLALVLPVVTGLLVDRVIPRGDLGVYRLVALGLAASVVFTFLTTLTRAYMHLELRTRVDAEMSLGFVDHVMKLPYAYFQLHPPGDLSVRFNGNARVREVLTTTTLSAFIDGVLAVLYVALLAVTSPSIAALTAAMGAIRVAVLLATNRYLKESQARSLDVQARAQDSQYEILNGIETIKVLGAEQTAGEDLANLYVRGLNIEVERGRVTAVIDALTTTFDVAAPLLVIAYGAELVMRGGMSLGEMLAVSALAAGVLGPLGNLVSAAAQLPVLGTYLERIDEVLDTAPEQRASAVTAAARLTGQIELHDVSFHFSPRSPAVVSNVSLRIPAGTQVAIVGRSGSGKTTLGRLLAGLYEPTSGRIAYDGVDLRTMELSSVRRQLGVVSQNAAVFAGSIRANVAMGRSELRLDAIERAAKLAEIHDDVQKMPMRYETPIAAGGGTLSGGQRQRVAIARAIVHTPPVLLFDEATSALDAVTEAAVLRNVRKLRSTRIMIAHRLSTVVEADLIVVMDAGRIVETGTHVELCARGGAYARLIAGQASTDGVGPRPA